MRVAGLVLSFFGWLLTPFVAWAASFVGAWLGTLLASILPSPTAGVALTAVLGGAAGFGTLILWIRLLRRSPRLRRTLHVTEAGTPDVLDQLPTPLGAADEAEDEDEPSLTTPTSR